MVIDTDNILLQPCDFIIGHTMINSDGYTCNTTSVYTLEFPEGKVHLCEEHRPEKLFKVRR